MAVLAIGVACIDTTIEIDEGLKENRKYTCSTCTMSGGGPAFNGAYLCALWQADAYLISRIGNDENGKRIHEIANQTTMNIIDVGTSAFTTAHSYIVSSTSTGSRTIFNYPCNEPLTNCTFPEADIRVILSDGHLPELTIKAHERYPKAKLIIDADIYNERTLKVCAQADSIICSEEFACDILGEALALQDIQKLNQQFEQLRKLNGKELIITIGDQGLIYKQGSCPERFPAYQVKAVDSCGAGDIFHGAYAWCVDQQKNFIDTLQIASMTAAISVTRKGTQTSIPTYDEVLACLDERNQIKAGN